jgi:hypothetical protein
MSERNGDVIWRARQFGAREGNAVRRAPFLASCHNAQDGTRYRGGLVRTLTVSEITIEFLAESSRVETAVVDIALKPDVRLGDPIVVELESTGYGVAALHGGAWADAGPADQEAAARNGERHFSRITEPFWNL